MKLIAHPRIHVGLADMSSTTLRRGAGVGFSIEGPATILEVTRTAASVSSMVGFEILDQAAQRDLQAVLSRIDAMTSDRGGFGARLMSTAPQHSGFGTKTSLALSLIAGARVVMGLDLSRNQMQQMSGRGGLSGIGIHAFFEGGVIWDGGHRQFSPKGRITRLVPLSAGSPADIPPLMMRFTFPSGWRVAVILDTSEQAPSGEAERAFFKANTPVPTSETLAVMGAIYHGVLPALRTQDLEMLGRSLRQLHSIGFKRRELDARGNRTREFLYELHSTQGLGVAAGLSSMGPAIYAI